MFAIATATSLSMLSVIGGVLLVVALLLCAHSKKSVKLEQPDIESNVPSETQEELPPVKIKAHSAPTTPNGNSTKIIDPLALDAERNITRHSKSQKNNVATRQSAKKPDKAKDPMARRPKSEHVGGLSPPFGGKLSMSTSERRLPAIPPPTAVPTPESNPPDFDQTYDFIPEHTNSKDPNYQMIKDAMDSNYQRVSDTEVKKTKRNPDYEIVKGETLAENMDKLKSDNVNASASKTKEDPYAKVKDEDTYTEVKTTDLTDQDYDADYAEVKGTDPYAKVENDLTPAVAVASGGATSDGAGATIGENKQQETKDYESVDDTDAAIGPGNHSPRPVEQQEFPLERMAPRAQPEIVTLDPVPGNRSEPPYTQVSARESLESIRERKERERQQNPSVYSSVDEESSADFDQLYEQVESVISPTSEVRPPALPPMANRISRVISSSDVIITVPQQSSTLPATGISLQQHYEEISTEGLPQAARQNTLPSPTALEPRGGTGMPLYAVVDKSKQKGGAKKQKQSDEKNATDFSYLYAKVDKNSKNKQATNQANTPNENLFAGTGARPKVKSHSSRDSTGSNEGIPIRETGYQSIEDCKDGDDKSPNSSQNATHQSYKNKESLHLYEAVSEKDEKIPLTITMPPRDMVHIESIKTPENFWKRKDHTYEAMANDDDDDGGEMKMTASKSSPSLKTSVRQLDHMYEEVRLQGNNSQPASIKIKSNTLNGDARDYRRQMEKEKISRNNNKGEKKKVKKQGKDGKVKHKADAKKQREKLKKHDYQNWPTRSPSM
ncbi:uncharacterized protein [Antedon mediterranea]|uniref:uncharacterized protein n=1 Tax=Antedon mediterranea TaxID=105859 RepID=UPI003AF94A53